MTHFASWVEVIFNLASAPVLAGWLKVPLLNQVSVKRKYVESALFCNANLFLSVNTYTLFSAGRKVTIRGRAFLHLLLFSQSARAGQWGIYSEGKD